MFQSVVFEVTQRIKLLRGRFKGESQLLIFFMFAMSWAAARPLPQLQLQHTAAATKARPRRATPARCRGVPPGVPDGHYALQRSKTARPSSQRRCACRGCPGRPHRSSCTRPLWGRWPRCTTSGHTSQSPVPPHPADQRPDNPLQTASRQQAPPMPD